MKRFKWLALLIVAGSTACFSPIYDTAMTQEGFTVGGGVAYQSGIEVSKNESWDDSTTARFAYIRPDINVNYGFNNWFSVVGRAGYLILIGTGWVVTVAPHRPCAGLGIKLSTPGPRILNLALRAEADYPYTFALTPMMGIATNKGHEFLTAGVQVTPSIMAGTLGFFINIHPFKDAHILVGSAFNPDPEYLYDLYHLIFIPWGYPYLRGGPWFNVGIGYTYNFGKKNE